MKLEERAEKLRQLGFFGQCSKDQLREILGRAEDPDQILADPEEAPATALLEAAECLLEISDIPPEEVDDYIEALKKLEEFCDEAFSLEEVIVEVREEESEEDEETLDLHLVLDDQTYDTVLKWTPDGIDLSFITLINSHLEKKGEVRRFCPLVELLDDTARFVFISPEVLEKAELDELVGAPDQQIRETTE